jgi:hypothetical protein
MPVVMHSQQQRQPTILWPHRRNWACLAGSAARYGKLSTAMGRPYHRQESRRIRHNNSVLLPAERAHLLVLLVSLKPVGNPSKMTLRAAQWRGMQLQLTHCSLLRAGSAHPSQLLHLNGVAWPMPGSYGRRELPVLLHVLQPLCCLI